MEAKTYVMVDLDLLKQIYDHCVEARGAIYPDVVGTGGSDRDRLARMREHGRKAIGHVTAAYDGVFLALSDGYALRNQARLRAQMELRA